MNRLAILIVCGCLINGITFAQRQIKFFTNTQSITEDRYEGVKGSPFLFKDWMKATIVDDQDSVYNDISLNYNAYEGNFEVLNGDEYIVLDDTHYNKITVHSDDGDILFEKDLNPKMKTKFYQVIYQGDKLMCFLDYSVGLTENTIQDVGKTVVQKRFKADPVHHFSINGNMTWVRLSKKKLIEVLGNKKLVDSYVKKNKLKINNPIDLGELLQYYEAEVLQ